MDSLSKIRTGLAATITATILYIICALAFLLIPEQTIAFFNGWFHGLDFSLLKPADGKIITIAIFIYGLVGLAVTSFITGWLFAFFYNRLKSCCG